MVSTYLFHCTVSCDNAGLAILMRLQHEVAERTGDPLMDETAEMAAFTAGTCKVNIPQVEICTFTLRRLPTDYVAMSR